MPCETKSTKVPPTLYARTESREQACETPTHLCSTDQAAHPSQNPPLPVGTTVPVWGLCLQLST
eukprot:5673553-Amphidinium_carterae.1